jgi:hypothetical protein
MWFRNITALVLMLGFGLICEVCHAEQNTAQGYYQQSVSAGAAELLNEICPGISAPKFDLADDYELHNYMQLDTQERLRYSLLALIGPQLGEKGKENWNIILNLSTKDSGNVLACIKSASARDLGNLCLYKGATMADVVANAGGVMGVLPNTYFNGSRSIVCLKTTRMPIGYRSRQNAIDIYGYGDSEGALFWLNRMLGSNAAEGETVSLEGFFCNSYERLSDNQRWQLALLILSNPAYNPSTDVKIRSLMQADSAQIRRNVSEKSVHHLLDTDKREEANKFWQRFASNLSDVLARK